MSELDDLREEVARLRREIASARSRSDLLATLVDNAPDFMAHITVDGRFLFLNRLAPGFERDELDRSTIYDFIDPAMHDTVRATIAEVVATRSQRSYESMAAAAYRESKPYYTRIAPVIREGVVESLVLIATDVSHLKEAEQAFLQSQAQLKHVLTATRMGTWWWDFETNQGGRDEMLHSLLGIDLAMTDKVELEQFVHPDDRAMLRAAFATASVDGVYGPLEHRAIRSDGSVRWISASGRIVEGPHGKRLIGGLLDITERKRLETELAQAQKLESIGRLAGGIAHDFNNMLTVISSNTELALRALPPDSPLRRDLNAVRLAAERSGALTQQLLAFARRQVIAPTICNIDPIVRRVEDLLRRVLGSRIEITMKLDASRRVRIDVSQFEQVLLNLTTNARDAMPEGGQLVVETSDVSVAANAPHAPANTVPGDYVRLRVTDTGQGISENDLQHIFEPFFTTKDAGLGTGLGLATCYGVVAQNGGFMTVKSSVGVGTTFEVYLPTAS